MDDLIIINLQKKANCLKGTVESYWFENRHTGLDKTLFHRIDIPLTPFNSGLEYEEQPLKTSILFEWAKLDLVNPEDLSDLDINHKLFPETECSVYVGLTHNICEVEMLKFTKVGNNQY